MRVPTDVGLLGAPIPISGISQLSGRRMLNTQSEYWVGDSRSRGRLWVLWVLWLLWFEFSHPCRPGVLVAREVARSSNTSRDTCGGQAPETAPLLHMA